VIKLYKGDDERLKIIFISLLMLSLVLNIAIAETIQTYPILIQFEDRSLRGDGIERYDLSYAESLAQQLFDDEVPEEFKDSMIFEKTGQVSQFYTFRWEREVNGIPVANEGLSLWVDYSSGEIVLWTLRLGYPESYIDITPKLSANQADYVVNKYYNADSVEEPEMLIIEDRLVWRINTGVASYSIDAETGETVSSSYVTGGASTGVVETTFNPTQYYIDTYGIYLTIVVGVSIVAYVGRDSISNLLRK